MYNICSSISKDIKLICIVSDYSIGKSPYSYKGVGYMPCIVKNIILDIYI